MSYREACRKLAKVRKPMLYLDERFRHPSSPSVPTLHFGLGYTAKGIIHCVKKRHLLPPVPKDQPLTQEQAAHRFSRAVFYVISYLEQKLQTPLFMRSSTSPDYIGLFCLYSNHTRRAYHQPEKEREILNFIRRELDVRKQQAAWYWDSSRHGLDYVCEYDEYNL
ncbi:unnamed protein product [Peniophora sp. CBMAI 1063]|nr:unnamed protein product [Peniophora sp. CBMAI 1063]